MRRNLPVTGRERAFPDGLAIVTVTDLKGRITYANPAFVEISGFSEAELLGQPHNLVRHPDMPPEAFRDLWATIEAGRPWSGLVKNRRKNGDNDWVQAGNAQTTTAAQRMHDVGGAMHGVGGVLGEVAGATHEQQQGIAQVSEAVAQIDGITQQNAAMIEELAASAQALATRALCTERAVRLLRLHAGDATLAEADAVALRREGAASQRAPVAA